MGLLPRKEGSRTTAFVDCPDFDAKFASFKATVAVTTRLLADAEKLAATPAAQKSSRHLGGALNELTTLFSPGDELQTVLARTSLIFNSLGQKEEALAGRLREIVAPVRSWLTLAQAKIKVSSSSLSSQENRSWSSTRVPVATSRRRRRRTP